MCELPYRGCSMVTHTEVSRKKCSCGQELKNTHGLRIHIFWANNRTRPQPVTVSGDLMNRVEYVAHHQYIAAVRGRPSSHTCSCGKPGYDWAYRHTAYGWERVTNFGAFWSEDIWNDYRPMCRSDHNRMDNAFDRGDSKRRLGRDQQRKAAKLSGKKTALQVWRCECGVESTPGGVGRHQKRTGCLSRERVS
jgi:hypothetical protein